VAGLAGVQQVTVGFPSGRMTVEYHPEETDLDAIERRVEQAGYRVAAAPIDVPSDDRGLFRRITSHRENILTLSGGILTLVAGVLSLTNAPTWIPITGYLGAILIAGLSVARKGWVSLFQTHRLDMNVLMSIAIIGAAGIGDWMEAATVAVLFSLGEALEAYSADRARRSISSLMSLAPTDALVRTPDGERRVPVGEIHVGDTVIIRPGERLPVDGEITAGRSTINEAPVTGESISIEKSTGDSVFAGTINGPGVLEVASTRPASDSTIARIIRMVEDAQEQKAPTQRFVDVFSAYYTPTVVAVAVVIALAPPLLLGSGWSDWIYRALVLLVVACPCALIISTPVTIVSAIATAAHNGVLIKGGAYLEAAGSIQALAFDKTGTLTVGHPEVTAIIPLNGIDERELLRHAAAVERYSEHPLGHAIVRAASDRGASVEDGAVSEVQSIPGRGISACVGTHLVRAGTRTLVLKDRHVPEIERRLVDLERAGQTAVLIEIDGQVAGIIGLADKLRAEAPDAIAAIKSSGIRETVMLTGDRAAVAHAIADTVGVDVVEAELLPDEKVAAVERLLERYGHVGMVGDGVNDAPALARSTIGIAMGVAGTDTALETADIALMSDDLSKVAYTLQLSRRAKRIIGQNITFALGLKLAFVALAILGTATLWEAVFADVGAALIVTLNGLRLLRYRAAAQM